MKRITVPSLGVCLLSGVAALALSCAIAPIRSIADDGITVVDDGVVASAGDAADSTGMSFVATGNLQTLYPAVPNHVVSYMDKDGETKSFDMSDDECIDIYDEKQPTLEDGKIYYVSRPILFGKRIEVKGDVTLVMPSGTRITTLDGIHCPKGSSITIAGEIGASTSLRSQVTQDRYDASIGGNDEQDAGDIAICGCTVESKAWRGSPIGGGCCGDGGNVTIRNAEVTVNAQEGAAGIGGGKAGLVHDAGDGGTVRIINSKVKAYASAEEDEDSGAGIGGGGDFWWTCCDQGRGGDVYISGNSYVDSESAGDAGAFGSGDDEGNNGSLTLEPGMHVVSQDKKHKDKVAELGQQKDWCLKHHHVIVERGMPAGLINISAPKIGGK